MTTPRPLIHVRLYADRCASIHAPGDHAVTAITAHAVEPGETVERLVCRLMEIGEFKQPHGYRPGPDSRIELQYVAGTEPELTPEQVAAANDPIF